MDLIYPKHRCYPPAPNWYSLYVTAVVEPHFYLYLSRNLVIVLALQDFRYINSFTAAEDKVDIMAAHGKCCYTAADKTVRLWDFMSGSLVSTHSEHSKDITALQIIRQGSVVISADKSGKFVLADAQLKSCKSHDTSLASPITCMAATQVDDSDYLAAGYENGMVFIYQVHSDLSMTIAAQIMEDTDPIQSLNWQQLQHSSPWPLLAFSTKRKPQILLWSNAAQSIISSIRLPRLPSQASNGGQKSAATWVHVNWLQEDTLYFTSYSGAIVCADISNPSRPLVNTKKRMDKHARSVFVLDFINQGSQMISVSMDAQIIKWDTQFGSDLQTLKTQTKYPYCIDTPAWDKGQLAIAMGEKEIKYWKFSTAQDVIQPQADPNYYEATVIWRGLQGKIQRIRNHPVVEGTSAYSDEFGHAGLCDSFVKNNGVKFHTHHTLNSAPFIDWGPDMCEVLQREDMRHPLISCGGDGTVHVYDMSNVKTPPVLLCQVMERLNPAWFNKLKSIDSHRHAFKVDPKLTRIAFGLTNGFIEIYNLKTLKLIYTSDYQRDCITSLDWKYVDDRLYLASGSRSGQIVVYDVSTVSLESEQDIPLLGQHTDLTEYSKHKESVNDIKWSSHPNKALFASASDDNYVYVWDTRHAEPIAKFNEHRSRVYTVEWNHITMDLLFSGGQDKFIYEWDYNDYPYDERKDAEPTKYHRERFALVKNKKKRKEAPNKTLSALPSSSTDTSIVSPAKKKAKADTDLPKPLLYAAQCSEASTSRLKREKYCLIVADNLLGGKVKEATNKIKESLTQKQLQDTTVQKYLAIWDVESTQKEPHQNIHELLYGDKNDIRRLLELEVDALDQEEHSLTDSWSMEEQNVKNKFDVKLAMNIMRCHFTAFDQDTTNNGLADWVILALSPMVGKEKWLELMLNQAKKMEKAKQLNLAASCYIACSHIYDAITMYREQRMFQEAIVIAKLRLPPGDPIIKSLFTDWAKELQKGNQDTLTATCYLLSDTEGSIEIAIDSLARDGKESGLFYAACLALAVDDTTHQQRLDRWLSLLTDRLKNKK
ncbi:WD40-repeat-containing domain protein [Mucor lusitanicus]|uniref:WD40-repeat-containing domain protein n=1 Tax=Mucor circinelloides f. lusitanicus TaxID=29924 RepID=A0A8H4BRV4_MUCCL|nr:WD40-repeat-containing domain protein [Mucor lusitanicus]